MNLVSRHDFTLRSDRAEAPVGLALLVVTLC